MITDTHLSDACDHAAYAIGKNPIPVKEVIASFVPEGALVHSRNVPTDKRADFLVALLALVRKYHLSQVRP